MKIKANIIQDIIIYILSIIVLGLAMLAFNQIGFNQFQQLEQQVKLIKQTDINIYNNLGEDVTDQIVDKYEHSKSTVERVRTIEGILLLCYALIGFVFVGYSIYQKINLITQTLSDSIKSLEALEPHITNSKYTEIIAINRNINHAINKINHKDQVRTQLYENMIHDFTTPLHILKGNLELLNHGIEIDLSVLNDQVDRLQQLTKSNIASQHSISDVVTSTDFISYFEQLQKIHTDYRFNIQIEPNLTFETNLDSLYRIIDNIIQNAIKHGEPSLISISLQLSNELLTLIISNDGKSIEPSLRDTLFERNTTSMDSGLGLNIVKTLVTELGYDISVTSTSELTSFLLTIPYN